MTRELVKKLKILLKHPFSWSIFHYRFFLRTTAIARFTANSLLQFLQEHFYGSIGSRVVTHYPIMGQGRGAHAQPAFFLAGLLFLLAMVDLRECERGTMMSMQSSDVMECGTSARRLLGTYPLPTRRPGPRIFQEESRGFVESDPSNSSDNRVYLHS